MTQILKARYTVGIQLGGRKVMLPMDLSAQAGEKIYLYGGKAKRQAHFGCLAGITRLDSGGVTILGKDLNTMTGEELAAFRRDNVGGIPEGGGLVPEIAMLPQVVLPMELAGATEDAVVTRLKELLFEQMPLHSLYNAPRQSNPRKVAYAAIFRAVIQKPKLVIINSFLDEWEELDSNLLWQSLMERLPKNSAFIYLSGAPAPEQVSWTQKIRI